MSRSLWLGSVSFSGGSPGPGVVVGRPAFHLVVAVPENDSRSLPLPFVQFVRFVVTNRLVRIPQSQPPLPQDHAMEFFDASLLQNRLVRDWFSHGYRYPLKKSPNFIRGLFPDGILHKQQPHR